MALDLSNIEAIKRCFPAAFYERGHRYYRQRRVHHLELTEPSRHRYLIQAMVKGSETYPVKISVMTNQKNCVFQGLALVRWSVTHLTQRLLTELRNQLFF